MARLFDVLLHVARALEATIEGVASSNSGGNTTLVDSNLPALGFNQDDAFNGGTLFYRGAGGTGAADSRVVSDYTQSSGTITVATALSATPQTGHHYALMSRRFPRYILQAKVQETLVEMGRVPIYDNSLITAANQLEYVLPAGIERDEVREIYLARNTAAPFEWERQLTCRIDFAMPSGSGSGAPVVRFMVQPDTGLRILIVHLARYGSALPLPAADSDAIAPPINAEWLALEAAVKCVRWRLNQPGADIDADTKLLNDLLRRAALQARLRQANIPRRQPVFPPNYD